MRECGMGVRVRDRESRGRRGRSQKPEVRKERKRAWTRRVSFRVVSFLLFVLFLGVGVGDRINLVFPFVCTRPGRSHFSFDHRSFVARTPRVSSSSLSGAGALSVAGSRFCFFLVMFVRSKLDKNASKSSPVPATCPAFVWGSPARAVAPFCLLPFCFPCRPP